MWERSQIGGVQCNMAGPVGPGRDRQGSNNYHTIERVCRTPESGCARGCSTYFFRRRHADLKRGRAITSNARFEVTVLGSALPLMRAAIQAKHGLYRCL